MQDERWRRLADEQAGLLTRAQLRACGFERWAVNHRFATKRWAELSPTVVGTTTGVLTREQVMWLGVLHAGDNAIVGDLTAAAVHGLKNWHRDEVVILVRRGLDTGDPLPSIRFVETRRPLRLLRDPRRQLPVARIEPAVLRFAAYQRSTRTAEGVVAAVVQQGLASPEALVDWVDRLQPLRWAQRFKRALGEIAGGAQSVSEIDVRRMCRTFSLALPRRQTKRRDAAGRSATPIANGSSRTTGSPCSRLTAASTWRSSTGRTTSLASARSPRPTGSSFVARRENCGRSQGTWRVTS